VWTTPGYQYGDRLFITPDQFEQRMAWLRKSPYPVLPLSEAVQRLDDGSLPGCAVAITIDDGWSSTYSHMLPVLEKYGLPATVYVTTWYCENQLPIVNIAVDYILKRAGRSPSDGHALIREIERLHPIADRERALCDIAARFGVTTEEWWENRQFHLMNDAEIREAHRRGLDIQLHTHRHISVAERVDELDREIADNRRALARASAREGSTFDHFCYPGGGYDSRAEAILKEARIKSATLVDQGINAPGTNPYRLRRFLDGRSVSQAKFEAYLSGALEIYDSL
jgi:peptidoglycan/xylan/chitin deacetylase (PgdA/CDA1 family)